MLPRRPVHPRSILTRLAPSLADASMRELGEGFDNVAYAVADDLVLRISKISDPVTRRRIALQDKRYAEFAGRHSRLATSRPASIELDEGALLSTLVPGVGADRRPPRGRSEFARTMADFLTGIWAAPADEVSAVVQPPEINAHQWLAQTTSVYESAAGHFSRRDRRMIESFLATRVLADDSWKVFSHNDLGDEHIIIGTDGAVSGVIDWSDAVLGDTARDVALLMLDFGWSVAAEIAALCAPDDPGLLGRARWWAARAGVEGVSWRALNRPGTVAPTMTRLRAVWNAG